MVYFAYALAILLSFVSNHYSDRAVAAIYPEREAELMAAHETRQDRQSALTAAHRVRYQQGNAATMELMQKILAEMNRSGFQQMPTAEEEVPKPGKDQIGFRQVSPEVMGTQDLDQKLKESEDRLFKIWKQIEERLDAFETKKEEEIPHISDPPAQVEYKKKEEKLTNHHPRFSKYMQPERYRDIDQERYHRFLKYAKKSLEDHRRYMKTRIAEQA